MTVDAGVEDCPAADPDADPEADPDVDFVAACARNEPEIAFSGAAVAITDEVEVW
ncbi:hypothetical protein JOD65_001674 [Nocardioides cavernae]|uniref:hypothetical protein n=1 Tax=Nocardioides cavernae TaxID=1921566 RepID=UPI001CD14047|nr:hypothetical protein [Nocardioides cavernae]MBM7512130.1 hypothetical protein [Nocardioides cavernae]